MAARFDFGDLQSHEHSILTTFAVTSLEVSLRRFHVQCLQNSACDADSGSHRVRPKCAGNYIILVAMLLVLGV
jgi:hypothetical protein